ncbi:hypothetical protein FPHOBKDP_00204 [Listeria phage LPJP1]|nr:hypothetical protein FPHOBKDP_00204 [Listeria phage LPJP1]
MMKNYLNELNEIFSNFLDYCSKFNYTMDNSDLLQVINNITSLHDIGRFRVIPPEFLLINSERLTSALIYLSALYNSQKKAINIMKLMLSCEDSILSDRINKYEFNMDLEITNKLNNDLRSNINLVEPVKQLKDVYQITDLISESHLGINPKMFKDKYTSNFTISNLKEKNSNYGSKLNSLLIRISYDNATKLLNFVSYAYNKGNSENKIDLHNFIENFPKTAIERLDDDETYIDTILAYIKRIYKSKDFLKLLNYINYQGVRESKNISDLRKYVNIIDNAKKGLSYGETSNGEMLFDDSKYNDMIKFTKEKVDINSIGFRTLCCFRPDGAAKSLLKPAIESPIAGILEGVFDTKTWFSFVWEIVEYNEDTKSYETNLILDNIESSKSLDMNEYEYIINWLDINSDYNKIYLGYLRNDINSNYKVSYTQRLRSSSEGLICYENNFNRYSSFDDSRYVFTVLDRKNNIKYIGSDNKDIIKKYSPYSEVIIEKASPGWFNRMLYVEKNVWKQDSDISELKKIARKMKSPSYIIRNDNNDIYGYLISNIYGYDPENESVQFNNRSFNTDTHSKLLYIEDIVIPFNKKITSSIKYIFEDLKKFIIDNDIKYISSSFNENSKQFMKRINIDGLEFIKDTRFNDRTSLKTSRPESVNIKEDAKIIINL